MRYLIILVLVVLVGCKKNESGVTFHNYTHAQMLEKSGFEYERPYYLSTSGYHPDTIVFHTNNTVTETYFRNGVSHVTVYSINAPITLDTIYAPSKSHPAFEFVLLTLPKITDTFISNTQFHSWISQGDLKSETPYTSNVDYLMFLIHTGDHIYYKKV